MNKKVLSFIVWTSLLFLTGITAGLVASLLTELISFIQALSFGYKEGSFSQQIALVSPSRRFISVTLAGCLAAFGWYFTFKYAKKIETIKDIVHKKAKVNPLSNFIHGMLQLITVSMGSPLGREGASREVAVSITALWLNYIPLKKDDISLLLACASGAALGAVYNAPLATIIFIIESILLKWSLRNLYAALITSFIAVWTVRLLVGSLVQYQLAPLNWNLSLFVWTIFAGFLLSIIIFGYKSLLLAIPKHQPASFKFIYSTIIAFVIAASISIFFPHILGNGKAGLLYYLHSDFQLSYVSLLLLAKALTVFIIFYAGAYGGRIAPSMMMGGGLGLLFSQLWNHTFQVKLPIQFAVIIGAALFLALINNIPLAASLFLIEITGQPLINILPIALAILIGFMTQKYLLRINKLLTIRKKTEKT